MELLLDKFEHKLTFDLGSWYCLPQRMRIYVGNRAANFVCRLEDGRSSEYIKLPQVDQKMTHPGAIVDN